MFNFGLQLLSMNIDNNLVVQLLRDIKDPSTGQDIISMKMVSDLRIEGQSVSMQIASKTKDMEIRSKLYEEIHTKIIGQYPNADINLHFKDVSAAQTPLPQVKNLIAVASGKGGVGKSTVSVNLALSLQQQGYKVGILDADLYGPSIPTMLGLSGMRPKVQKLYGRNVIVPIDADGLHVMSIGFIVEPEQAVVLRGPRLGGIIKQFINETVWPELDFIIIDLPPGTGDIQLTMVQTIPLTGVVMVTTPQQVAIIDAVKAMNMFRLDNIGVPILGVVENMSWFTPAELPDNKYKIFGEGGGQKLSLMAKSVLLGQVPLIQSAREGGDKGKPAVTQDGHAFKGIFQTISQKLIYQINLRNEAHGPTQIVQTS